MLFIVSGKDWPNGIAKRLEFRQAHRAHYEGLADDLILSGPYLDQDGDPIGSMIVMRAKDQLAADDIVASDPYIVNSVFEHVTVSRWDWFMKRPDNLTTDLS